MNNLPYDGWADMGPDDFADQFNVTQEPSVEHTHYYRTPKEMDILSGKGPGTHDHDAALCGYGSFHFKRSRKWKEVTCPKCLERKPRDPS